MPPSSRTKVFAVAMVAMTACGAAAATTVTDRDVRAVPFIQDGRLAFTVYNQND